MPYVFYDELPEGLEEADVVSHEHYDALADELASTVAQRDEALEHLETSRKETRDAKAKYARLILDGNKQKDVEKEKDKEKERPRGKTSADLFAIKE